MALTWLAGSTLVASGSLVVGYALFSSGLEQGVRWIVLCAGIVVTGAGPLITLWRLRRAWAVDSFLAISPRGLIRSIDGRCEWVPWSSVSQVRFDHELMCVQVWLRRGGKVPLAWSADEDAQLAAELERARIRLEWGVL